MQPLSYQIPVLTCIMISQNLHLVLTYLFPILQPELPFQNENHIIPPFATFCNTTMASYHPKNKDQSVWHCFEACMGGPYFFRFTSNLSSSVSYTPAILDFQFLKSSMFCPAPCHWQMLFPLWNKFLLPIIQLTFIQMVCWTDIRINHQ